MKRNLLTIMLLWLLLLPTYSQSESQIKTLINNAASRMQSMTCDFVQTKHLKLLNDKMVSRGKMYYQQRDKLRWEYVSPYQYTFIINGSQVLLKNNGIRYKNGCLRQDRLRQKCKALLMFYLRKRSRPLKRNRL